MALLDFGSGLLPFNDRWQSVIDAMQGGQFDPQGGNASQALLSLPAPQQQAMAQGQIPMPMPRPDMNMPPQAMPTAGTMPGTPQGSAMSGGGLPIPGLGNMNMPSGGFPNPFGEGAPGIGDRLQAAGAGFFNAGSPMQAIGNLLGGLVTGQRQDAAGINAQNQFAMFQALQKAGMSPAMARLGAMDPKIAESMMSQPELVKTYQYAKGQGYQGSLQDWNSDLKGEKTTNIDTGTTVEIRDKQNPQKVLAVIPKNLAQAAAEEAKGKGQGGAAAVTPGAVIQAEQTIKQAENLISDPGMEMTVGTLLHGRALPGTKEADFLAKLNQLKGTSFLQAYETLKGGGAITEVEGKKAQDAIARMDTAQSKDAFRQSMRDYIDAVRTGVKKLQANAGGAAPTGGVRKYNPQTGMIE
jgi:hypothetical protein